MFSAQDPSGPVTIECSADGAAFAACMSPVSLHDLADGEHTMVLRARDAAGNLGGPWATAWVVDATAPSVGMSAPAATFTLSSKLAAAWTAADAGSGVASSDVRWRRSRLGGEWSAWTAPAAWQATAASTVTLDGAARGYSYCLAARVRDKAGNVSGWSAPRCTGVPLDDRDLVASAGWTTATGAAHYAGTYLKTSVVAQLTAPKATVRAVALVAARCDGCGVVGVYLGDTLVKKISLDAPTAKRQVVIPVASYTTDRTGVFSIRVLSSGKPVHIDGLATSR